MEGGSVVYVTRKELNAVIAAEREWLLSLLEQRRAERDEITSGTVAAVVWGCAKAWLPGHAAHVGRSIVCIEALARVTTNERVADALANLVEALREMRPTAEDQSGTVVRIAHH